MTFYKSINDKMENNKVAAIVLFACILIIGLSVLLTAVDDIRIKIVKWYNEIKEFFVISSSKSETEFKTEIPDTTSPETQKDTSNSSESMVGDNSSREKDQQQSVQVDTLLSLESSNSINPGLAVLVPAAPHLIPEPLVICSLVTSPEVRGGCVYVDKQLHTSIPWGSLYAVIEIERGEREIIMKNNSDSCYIRINIKNDTLLNPCF